MKTPAVEEPVPVATVAAGPDEWLALSRASKFARVSRTRVLQAIADGELTCRIDGPRRYLLRRELEAWAPRPVHLTAAERRAEVERSAQLWNTGLGVHAIAAKLQRSATTVAAYLDEAGIERSYGPRPRYERAEERECGRSGCATRFTPEGWRAAAGGGIYCSEECRRSVFLETFAIEVKYPEPEERPCGHCGRPFTPSRANAGRGHGTFCSRRCSALDRWRRPGGGNLSQLVRRNPLAGGRFRSVWLGRWEGAVAGARGGRPKGYTAAQADAVIDDRLRLGKRASERWLAERHGLSKRQVHDILTR